MGRNECGCSSGWAFRVLNAVYVMFLRVLGTSSLTIEWLLMADAGSSGQCLNTGY